MPNLTFRGATIRYFDCRLQEGSAFTRIHASADFTDPVRDEMEWPDISDEIQSCKLSGKLAGEYFVLTPNDKALKQYEFQLPVGDVTDFEVAHVKDEDREATRKELRFKMRTTSASAATQLYEYLSKVGKTGASMKLKYSVQDDLNKQSDVIDDKQKVLEMPQPEDDQDSENPVSINDLNAAGSGRQRKKRTRGEMSASVVVEDDPAARANVERVIDASLQ